MPDPKMARKGPYVIEETPGDKWWCSCGHSEKQPYCDGAHKRLNTGMAPIKVEIKEAGKVAWCGCKHSKTNPYCDGSHRSL